MTTDVTLFRNWRKICAITNPHLFLFVALGKIEEVLNTLSPTLIEHYFTEVKPE